MRRKQKIAFREDEINIIINSLMEWRNQLIREGRYTDAIDDLSPEAS